jgi:hypothetical protein
MGLADIDANSLRMDNVAAIPDLLCIGEKAAGVVDFPRQFAPFMPQGSR